VVRGRWSSYVVPVVALGALGLASPAHAEPNWTDVPPPQEVVQGLLLRKAPEPKPTVDPLRGVARLRKKVELPTSLDLTFAHANITSQQSTGAFSADLSRVLATQPDLLTLNEAVRPDEMLARVGYAHYRGFDSRWTMETTVMWREDRFDVVSTGTRYLHQRPGTWGTRATNWVVLEDRVTGRQLSLVSAHPSPDGPSSRGLLPVYMGGLAALVRELAVTGPVFVGGDLNAHYTSGRFPRPALASAGLTPTFDVYGMPAGGTGDHGGATIDYLLYQPGAGVVANSQTKLELNSDHDALVGTFTWSW
jgi:endonuclease/exonuclease/phosphatase (EEP) superfamily protein YafD